MTSIDAATDTPADSSTIAQRRAIEAPLGPTLVVAGPGAGKTYCLIRRIQHVIQHYDVPPPKICAVTFTNKAADEIAHRLRHHLGSSADEITRGTLHALCHSILREHWRTAGLPQGFGIAATEDRTRILRRLKVPPRRHTQLVELFGRHRLQGYELTVSDKALHDAYRDTLRSRKLVDFDDLIALTGELLDGDAEAATATRARWDYVLIDEFQDTSLAQYRVLKSLVQVHRRCFAVGDDEQSIYSWTGADPHILERFRTEFDVQDTVVLDHNRRCSTQIFEVARRLVRCNPALFTKQIEATRVSEHPVTAIVFNDEELEASWLIADLKRDQAASGLGWGEYALLYRQHQLGEYLESRLVQADIPCRLAKGQALMDDDVIAHVVTCLRLVRSPEDTLALETLAERLLPPGTYSQVRATERSPDVLLNLRRFLATLPKTHSDRAPSWRFVFHVENLAGMARQYETLPALVDELLTHRIVPYRNPLAEHTAELSDPAEYPGARALAQHMKRARDSRQCVRVERDGGVEIPVVCMLMAAGLPAVAPLSPGETPSPGDYIVGPGHASCGQWSLLVFKALQLLQSAEQDTHLLNYVAFDLETTDKDVDGCEIVQIAAVRVRNGVIVEQFERLVRPARPISPAATKVHGYYDADVRDEPAFIEIWPAFVDFVQTDLLVAHNGHEFDVPVLRRMGAGLSGLESLVFFDSLPLARSLCSGSAKLSDLAREFGVDVGRAHDALNDASMLVGVIRHLRELRATCTRKTAMTQGLGYLGLALALREDQQLTREELLLRDLAVPAALGRFSSCLEVYTAQYESAGAPPPTELIERLGGMRVLERLQRERSPAERFPEAVERLGALVAASQGETLPESIDALVARAALSTSTDVEADRHRVNLLTLHATKGLEFSRVFVVGAEDALLPGWRELQNEDEKAIQEGRRLLYVGMTRAMDKLVLTRVRRRRGWDCGGDLFLREAGLAATAGEPAALS